MISLLKGITPIDTINIKQAQLYDSMSVFRDEMQKRFANFNVTTQEGRLESTK